MNIGERLSVDHVKAMWALNEIRSPRTRCHYQDDRVPALLTKLAGVKGDQLKASTDEFRELIDLFKKARLAFLHMYFNRISEFVMEQWSAERLCMTSAMSQMDPLGKGRFISVLNFALSPPPLGTGDGDPRIAAAKIPVSEGPFRVSEPVVIGLCNNRRVLIDGYCRSILFMRSAGSDDRIPVLVPVEV